MNRLIWTAAEFTAAVAPLAGGLCALAAPRPAAALARVGDRVLWRAGRRRFAAPAVAFILSLALSVGICLCTAMPAPTVQDEFSYLLAADTYAHGRLTNPTHPMWEHFEVFHVIQRPTYMSKYQPAPGMAMALGQRLVRRPIVGVWLSEALACAAVAWMLLAWVPPRWALIGSLLATSLPIVISWGVCYWGGAIPMAGGALVMGAMRRIMKKPSARMAFILGAGGALCALSRPFEGSLLCAAAGLALLVWWVRIASTPARLKVAARVLVPLLILGIALAAFIGFYDYRVTGRPLKMAYSAHEEQYGATPLFLFQRFGPPPRFRHANMRDVAMIVRKNALWDRDHPLVLLRARLTLLFRGLVQPKGLLIALLFLPAVLRRDRRMLIAFLTACAVIAGTFLCSWLFMHYIAPAICVVVLCAVQGIRHLRQVRWGPIRVGRLSALALVASFIWPAARAFSRDFRALAIGLWDVHSEALADHRVRIAADLRKRPARQLVFVRYDWPTFFDWCYNESNIDRSKIVWARAMSPAKDRELADYYPDREKWTITGSDETSVLLPYIPSK